jgi:decaprenylphospho-beta-D-ribofuranose 2-oxidase
MKQAVTNWGKYPVIEADLVSPSVPEDLLFYPNGHKPLIARGLGRCYGDSALSETIVSTLQWNKFLQFDENTGILVCESGASFEDIILTFLPRGFFLPVTPGTKFITVGGAIASDIHGKNHHSEGTFSHHLHWIDLLTADKGIIRCSKLENADLFWATCGGMGLTGIIVRACFSLKKVETAYIKQTSIKAKNLDHIMDLLAEYGHFTYSVAWIDCLSKGNSLGRSILLLGEHAQTEDLSDNQKKRPFATHKDSPILVPFDFPSFTLNHLSVSAFNFLFYNKTRSGIRENVIHYDPYYYPLDAIHHWNRIYGKRGFTQYQFVIPLEGGREGMRKILKKVTESGESSFLSVLKIFGKEQQRGLLFPAEGYTLTLDFPITKSVFKLLDELDQMVVDLGGKVYLTKDVRLSAETFAKMYPKADFQAIRNQMGSVGVFESEQSKRLF